MDSKRTKNCMDAFNLNKMCDYLNKSAVIEKKPLEPNNVVEKAMDTDDHVPRNTLIDTSNGREGDFEKSCGYNKIA